MAADAGDALLTYSVLLLLFVWSVVEYLRVPRERRRLLQSTAMFLCAGLFKAVHRTPLEQAVSWAAWMLPIIVLVNFYNRSQVSKLERERQQEKLRAREEEALRERRTLRNAKAVRDEKFGLRATVEWRKAAERGLRRLNDAPARDSD